MSLYHSVYLTNEEIERVSINSGLDSYCSYQLRNYGCELIQEGGILLILPQVCVATAQTFFHRFYCVESFIDFNVEKIAIASLFLSSKLEECIRDPREFVLVFDCLFKRRSAPKEFMHSKIEPLSLDSPFFIQSKMELFENERLILQKIGFNLFVEHPYKFLLNYLLLLNITEKDFRQRAWNYVNDSYRTTVCMQFPPEFIAVSCIYMTSKMYKYPLPESPYPWWEIFSCTLKEVNAICWMISRLYKSGPAFNPLKSNLIKSTKIEANHLSKGDYSSGKKNSKEIKKSGHKQDFEEKTYHDRYYQRRLDRGKDKETYNTRKGHKKRYEEDESDVIRNESYENRRHYKRRYHEFLSPEKHKKY